MEGCDRVLWRLSNVMSLGVGFHYFFALAKNHGKLTLKTCGNL